MAAPVSAFPAHRFSVELDGRPVVVSEVLGIGVAPGSKPAAVVTLRRAAGADRTLFDWALKPTAAAVTVTLLGPQGDAVVRYVLGDARPTVWRGPVLDATSTEIATEELVLSVGRVDLR